MKSRSWAGSCGKGLGRHGHASLEPDVGDARRLISCSARRRGSVPSSRRIDHRCLVRFDKGTFVIAAVALVVAILLSALGGSVAGVFVAALVGVAAAAAWQLRLNWLAGAARRAQLEKTKARYALPGLAPAGGVAQLLRPEAEVVSFRPRPELDQLIRWVAASEAHVTVQLATGAGGTGKTRLARQLAHELAGWRTHWVPAGSEREAVGIVKDVGESVLLVVDYAETRRDLGKLLAEASNDTDGPDMRVLLLARSAGEWWRKLITNSDYQLSELLAGVRPITLGPLSDRAQQSEVFHEALVAFASKLGVERPAAEVTLTDPDAVVLAIHAAALLAVLDHSSVGHAVSAPHTVADALAGLLRHEARYWQQSQDARDLRLDLEVTRRAVAAGCLVGADDETRANRLLASIADLADSAQLRGQSARWLHDLYPVINDALASEWIGLLQPDLLAEQLVVTVLSEQPGLTTSFLAGQPEWRVFRALTILARAAFNDSLAADLLGLALQSDPENLVLPALAVAVETNPAVAGMIKNALASSKVSYHFLEHVLAELPHESLALAETSVAVSQRLVDESESDSPQHAVLLVYLSNWLSDLGRREEALSAIEEAVTINRARAETRSNDFLPTLASALINQSDRLSDLGRREEALSASEEAVAIYRQLAQIQPDAFLPDMVFSLNSLSNHLSDLGRREEALSASEEAVAFYRQIAETQPDMFLPDMAFMLNSLSNHLADLGRGEQALAASNDAVAAFRQMAQTRPDVSLRGLGSALNNQANHLLALGRREQALAAIEEAVTIRRALAQSWPDAFLPQLAMSLHNLSNALSKLDKRDEALIASKEAVAAYRQLAEARPDAFLPELIVSLNSQSNRLVSLGRPEEAIVVSEEAVATSRNLAQANAEVFLPSLASALNGQSQCLSDLGRLEEALAASEEVVSIRRTLVQEDPAALFSDLVSALNSQAGVLWKLGRTEDALATSEEAVAAARELAQASPDAFLPDLAQSLHNQSLSLFELGRREEALVASEQSVATYRRLSQAQPSAFLHELGMSLNNLANILTSLDRKSDADAARTEAALLDQEDDK